MALLFITLGRKSPSGQFQGLLEDILSCSLPGLRSVPAEVTDQKALFCCFQIPHSTPLKDESPDVLSILTTFTICSSGL